MTCTVMCIYKILEPFQILEECKFDFFLFICMHNKMNLHIIKIVLLYAFLTIKLLACKNYLNIQAIQCTELSNSF